MLVLFGSCSPAITTIFFDYPSTTLRMTIKKVFTFLSGLKLKFVLVKPTQKLLQNLISPDIRDSDWSQEALAGQNLTKELQVLRYKNLVIKVIFENLIAICHTQYAELNHV